MSQSLLTSAATKLHRAVFLDRDGVINRALVRDGQPYPPTSLAEFEVLRVRQLRVEAQGLADACICPKQG